MNDSGVRTEERKKGRSEPIKKRITAFGKKWKKEEQRRLGKNGKLASSIDRSIKNGILRANEYRWNKAGKRGSVGVGGECGTLSSSSFSHFLSLTSKEKKRIRKFQKGEKIPGAASKKRREREKTRLTTRECILLE